MCAVGMLYEIHPQYSKYIASSFNANSTRVATTITLLQDALTLKKRLSIFLNAGVFIVDCVLWRQQNLTRQAEELILENSLHPGGLYSSSAGDQGLFYLLLGKDAFGLPARWNMRRQPKKTVQMLEDPSAITGVVHLAGSTGGRSTRLCDAPLQYPLFLPAVVPLFLSITSQFLKLHSGALNVSFSATCVSAVTDVRSELVRRKVVVKYNPGVGLFNWPPSF
jgi:Glycosyl transferase family 8